MNKTTALLIALALTFTQQSLASPKSSEDKRFRGEIFSSKHSELTLNYQFKQSSVKPTKVSNFTSAQKNQSPSSQSAYRSLVQISKKYIGTPYRYGGTTPRGFDCSGFVSYVYKQKGYTLPRTSAAQYAKLSPVKTPQPGDLVFFRRGRGGRIGHVGLYIGNGKMIHAPRTGERVRIESIEKPNWQRRYAGARRLSLHDSMVAKADTHRIIK